MINRDVRQIEVADWCAAAFGEGQASSVEQRGLRLAEEAIEAAQAAGCDPATLHSLISYVYARPAGTMAREIGGVGVTVLALANAAGLSADQCESDEVARVLSKPLAHFTERNKVKNDAGFIARSAQRDANGEEVLRLRSKLRAIELAVDGLNTKAFRQKPETQAVLNRIKATAREGLK